MQYRVVLLWGQSQTSADGDSVQAAVTHALDESRSLQLACAEQRTVALVVFQMSQDSSRSMDVIASQKLSEFLIASKNSYSDSVGESGVSTVANSQAPLLSESDVVWGALEVASLLRMKPAVLLRTLRLNPRVLPVPSRKVGRNNLWSPSKVLEWLNVQESTEPIPAKRRRGRPPKRLPGA